jgi:hypothetical protein
MLKLNEQVESNKFEKVTREKEMNINYTKKSFTCSNKFGGYVPS